MKRQLCILLLIFCGTLQVALSQVIQYKAVYYNPARASFAADLADDTPFPGTSESPRTVTIRNLDNHFAFLAQQLKANAVVVQLNSDDGWHAQYGGGHSYNPICRPKPQQAVGQEIIISIANKWGLKVIFVINFSDYQISTDDTYGTGAAYGCPSMTPGLYDYIHACIDPEVYYGQLYTTKLELVGLPNSHIRPYYEDPRVAGWLFGGEWNTVNAPGHEYMVIKYWEFFYNLVHWNPNAQGFGGIYVQGGPDTKNDARARIQSLKNLLRPGNPWNNPQPDLFGIEWYGSGSYPLANVSADLQEITGWAMNDIYYIPPSGVALMEGGSDQVSNPGRPQFYTDAIERAARIDGTNPARGIFVYNSDGIINDICSTGIGAYQDTFAPLNYGISVTSYPCRVYPDDPITWHNGSTPVTETNLQVKLDLVTFNSLRDIGVRIANAFLAH